MTYIPVTQDEINAIEWCKTRVLPHLPHNEWRSLNDLRKYANLSWNELDTLAQAGIIDQKIELVYRNGRAVGSKHYYKGKDT